MISASLFKEGKLATPIALPKAVNEVTDVLGQIITKLSGFNMKLAVMVAVVLPSLSLQLRILKAVVETFFSSMNSALGSCTGGAGSANSSSMTTSKRLAIWAKALLYISRRPHAVNMRRKAGSIIIDWFKYYLSRAMPWAGKSKKYIKK